MIAHRSLFAAQDVLEDSLDGDFYAAGRGRVPPLDSQLLGLTELQALGRSSVSGEFDGAQFEQIFSFQYSTRT